MEHSANIPPAAATDEPAVPPTPDPVFPFARISDRLPESLIEPAVDAGRDSRSGRARRSDGWTPERVRVFLEALAQCGVVEDAARAAAMSPRSAYNLRNSAKGAAFRIAWDGACHLARRHIADVVVSRALHGCVEVIIRDGKVWGERHRNDNRLTMAVLARLDRQCESNTEENRIARIVAQEYDRFLDIACADGEGAAEFISARGGEGYAHHTDNTALNLHRLADYCRHCAGQRDEYDLSDVEGEEDQEDEDDEEGAHQDEAEDWGKFAGEGHELTPEQRPILETALRLDSEPVRRDLAAHASVREPSGQEMPVAKPEMDASPAESPTAKGPATPAEADGEEAPLAEAATEPQPAKPAAEPDQAEATAPGAAPGESDLDGPPPPGWVAPGR